MCIEIVQINYFMWLLCDVVHPIMLLPSALLMVLLSKWVISKFTAMCSEVRGSYGTGLIHVLTCYLVTNLDTAHACYYGLVLWPLHWGDCHWDRQWTPGKVGIPSSWSGGALPTLSVSAPKCGKPPTLKPINWFFIYNFCHFIVCWDGDNPLSARLLVYAGNNIPEKAM